MPLVLAMIAINGVTGASVAAQTADEQAPVPLSPNERVRVQDATGRRLVGTFTAADPERLILTIDGTPVTLQRSTVARLERQQRDSVWNGVFIGAGIGGGAGLLSLQAARDSEAIYLMMAVAPAAAAGGAILGWILDRNSDSWREVDPHRVTIRVVPVVTIRAAAIGGAVGW